MDLFSNKAIFHQILAAWYATAQRPLPWRTKPSLYRTVVSELMAQQTQIKTMLPYFKRWMQRFPDFNTLANATKEDVLKHWEGLGYYSRARNLHRLAKEYVALDPKPANREEWQRRPGIGSYTSAAITSIALGQPAAVVDGNVVRVLARITNDTNIFKSNGEAVKAFTARADELLDIKNPGDHNQAMMELGSTVCLKHKPLCNICPILEFCVSNKNGTQNELPKIKRKATVQIEMDRAWIVEDAKLLLHRSPESAGQLAGQYELPQLSIVKARETPQLIASKSRSITHRRIKEYIYKTILGEIDDSLVWVAFDKLDTITLSGPHRRWIRQLLKCQ